MTKATAFDRIRGIAAIGLSRIAAPALFGVVTLLAMSCDAVAGPCNACPPNQDVAIAIIANVAEIEGVEERPKWWDTGVDVIVGQTICITASGTVFDGGGYAGDPNGNLLLCGDPSPTFPDWNECVAHLALVGRIRRPDNIRVWLDDGVPGAACPNGRPPVCGPFPTLFGPGHVGISFAGTASDAGRIELALNDGDTDNNSGSFTARVKTLLCPTATETMPWGRIKGLYR